MPTVSRTTTTVELERGQNTDCEAGPGVRLLADVLDQVSGGAPGGDTAEGFNLDMGFDLDFDSGPPFQLVFPPPEGDLF